MDRTNEMWTPSDLREEKVEKVSELKHVTFHGAP